MLLYFDKQILSGKIIFQIYKLQFGVMNFLKRLDSGPSKKLKRTIEIDEKEKKPIIFHGKSIYVFVEKCTKQIKKFLRDVCDPVSKPQKVHEYVITKQSLVRAQALGYSKKQIIQTFSKNMKNQGPIPQQVQSKVNSYVRQSDCQLFLIWTGDYCYYQFLIDKFNYNQVKDSIKNIVKQNKQIQIDGKQMLQFKVETFKHIQLQQQLQMKSFPVRADRKVSSFLPNDLKKLKGAKNIAYCHDIQINLKSFTQLRQYQAQALNAVIRVDGQNVYSKSGYIVLPCGAGKTLLGISILCKIKKQCLIVCSSDAGTQQWKRQIQKWTQSFPRQQINIVTSDSKFQFKNSTQGQIYISTYSFLKTHVNSKKDFIQQKDQWLVTKPWGLVIFDECQTLPATENQQIAFTLFAQVKIGLTATPLRQDDEIKNLNFMIGPQLYVGDWKTFVQQGYLANPKCIQVRTQLTPFFKEKYRRQGEVEKSKQRRQMCYKINPNKVKALLFLLHHHEALNDHILVFSDDVQILRFLAAKLRRPFLAGSAKAQERMFIFDMFRKGTIKTLFLSRIGDEAIDLPNANVGIELNIQHGSRKQMLQRLGRIMRQKQASSSLSYNAMFYTITTHDTLQWKYFFKRYRCLIDEGFHYDLRLFQYKPRQIQDIDNILKLDSKVKDQIEQKFKNIISNQQQYWNSFVKSQKDQ